MDVTKKFGKMGQFMALKAMIALLSLFFILDPVVFVMAGKDGKKGKSDLDA